MKNKKAISAAYFLLLVILMICGQNLLEVLTSIAGAIFFVILKRRGKLKCFNDLFIKWKKIKELEFYKISDFDKKWDLKERKKICESFSNLTLYTMAILVMDCFCISNLISRFINSNNFFNSIIILISVIACIILFSGQIVSFCSNHIVWTYLLIPVIGYIISEWMIEVMENYSFVKNNQNLFLVIGTILASTMLYFLLVVISPSYILKKLSNKTAIISVCLTLLTFITTQFLIPYVMGQASSQYITLETVKGMKDTSDDLKEILINHPEFIEILNYVLSNEGKSYANTEISIFLTPITIAYTFGGLMINWKITRNRKKAESIFRKLILSNDYCCYANIIKCSFYGGEEYDNLLLVNEKTRFIIFSIE